ncbi:MAG TPA: hypothetical protein VGW76_20470 [Pyrinomonadaceae bacterium]|nr:hypothetical protein [Pyrinomonadaceae bacterium]
MVFDASRRHEFSPAFKAGDHRIDSCRRVATIELSTTFRRRYATRDTSLTLPGIERPG